MRERALWVVEVKFEEDPDWSPTVGSKLTRDEGRGELKEWRKHLKCDKFRLVKYVPSALVEKHRSGK